MARYMDLKDRSRNMHVRELEQMSVVINDYQCHNLNMIREREALRKQVDGLVEQRDVLLEELDDVKYYLKWYIERFDVPPEEVEKGEDSLSSLPSYVTSPLAHYTPASADSLCEDESPMGPSPPRLGRRRKHKVSNGEELRRKALANAHAASFKVPDEFLE